LCASCALFLIERLNEAKIQHLDDIRLAAAPIEHDVGRFNVAMH
jgi:hypothetical protein